MSVMNLDLGTKFGVPARIWLLVASWLQWAGVGVGIPYQQPGPFVLRTFSVIAWSGTSCPKAWLLVQRIDKPLWVDDWLDFWHRMSLWCVHLETPFPPLWAFPLWNKPFCFVFVWASILEKVIVVGLPPDLWTGSFAFVCFCLPLLCFVCLCLCFLCSLCTFIL